jgi:hypothetical protein
MATNAGQPQRRGTAVLRRTSRATTGQPDIGWTEPYDTYELICPECGDDATRDYHEVSPRLQHLRGPYWLEPGVEAYELHRRYHHGVPPAGDRPARELAGRPGRGAWPLPRAGGLAAAPGPLVLPCAR